MKNTTWALEDVALALYAYMRRNEEFDYIITDLYKADINRNLTEINSILEEIVDFQTQETLFNLIDELQQCEKKSGFIDGLKTGLGMGRLFDI